MLKKVGSWIGSIKRYINDVQNEISDLDIKDLDKDKEVKNNKENINDK